MKNLFYHSPHRDGEKRFTIAAVVDGNNMSFGVSACSHRDNFKKKTGRAISLGRASKKPYFNLEIEKDAKLGLAFRQVAKRTVEELENETAYVEDGVIHAYVEEETEITSKVEA